MAKNEIFRNGIMLFLSGWYGVESTGSKPPEAMRKTPLNTGDVSIFKKRSEVVEQTHTKVGDCCCPPTKEMPL
jgi:hypothetical protein